MHLTCKNTPVSLIRMEGKWKLEADPSLSSCNERHLQQFGNRTSQCYLLNFGMVTLHFAWYLLHLAMFAFHFAWYLSRFSMSTSHLHGICMVFATFWYFKHSRGSLEGSLGFHLGCHLRFHLGFHLGFYLRLHLGFY
jgi:hypothetical protein